MIRIKGTIEYENGSTAEFETGSAALAEWELYALRHGYPTSPEEAPRMLSMLVVAHYALGIEEGVDVWRRSVNGIDLTTEGIPPTLPVVTGVA